MWLLAGVCVNNFCLGQGLKPTTEAKRGRGHWALKRPNFIVMWMFKGVASKLDGPRMALSPRWKYKGKEEVQAESHFSFHSNHIHESFLSQQTPPHRKLPQAAAEVQTYKNLCQNAHRVNKNANENDGFKSNWPTKRITRWISRSMQMDQENTRGTIGNSSSFHFLVVARSSSSSSNLL